jgi:hypothetical protein
VGDIPPIPGNVSGGLVGDSAQHPHSCAGVRASPQ